MSGDQRVSPEYNANASWLLSESAARAIQSSLFRTARVAEEALREVRDNVRRNLNEYYSSDSQSEIESEREFPLNFDSALFTNSVEQNSDADSESSTTSHVTNRRDFSLTSYDSSIFNPEEHYREMSRRQENVAQPVSDAAVDREIDRLREESSRELLEVSPPPRARRNGVSVEQPDDVREMIHDVMRVMREMRLEMNGLRDRARLSPQLEARDRRDYENEGITYGRTSRDIRNQAEHAIGYLRLKEARDMIPEFDGTPSKLQEFLSAAAYAIKNINPMEEGTLLEAVLCTKLKGRAMIDFQTREIRDFTQLKKELEVSYLSRKSTTHLQLEFNTLKQKQGEGARTFGLRVDKLAMELFESMVEGRNHAPEGKRIILETIQQQALQNYQLGLRDEIKLLVRAQHFATLQDAIAGASAEEKVNGPSGIPQRSKFNAPSPRENKSYIQCQKCGKNGHYGRDCRTSRYANRFSLPKPDRPPRVNTMEKYCKYCKKSGHLREECWLLNGRPHKEQANQAKSSNFKGPKNYNFNKTGPKKRTSPTQSSDEEDRGETKQRRPASEYQISHLKNIPQMHTGLDLVTLPMKEAKREKVNLLFDTGAALSLIKVKQLKGETLIEEDAITLTGVTGHKIQTIGKITATINLKGRQIRHVIYVVRDSFPIDYDGILGIDFLKRQRATCDYRTKQLKVGQCILRLYPYKRMILEPRSETIIQVATDKNTIGIIQAEETQPGIFVGNCLVEPENYLCAASILNTTDNTVEMLMPQVEIEDMQSRKEIKEIPITQVQLKEGIISRNKKVLQLIRTQHLNTEEKKAITEICQDFSDVFHIEGEQLTCTNTVAHQIATQADSSPVNVRPYRLPEKHKEEVNRQVQDMLRHGIIRPSTSQWNAPLLVVPKKADASGKPKLRVVVDFRKLNDLTIGDSFPLPNITDILDQLGNAKYFTTLDLASGYHQIPMEESNKNKTAFSTPHGHYEYNRMPFGLKNAPATFQRLMNSILIGVQGIKCLVYLDDIVIYAASLHEHNRRLMEVLKRLREHNLKLQPDKCEFLRKEVTYLGHVITENGISPDPTKLEAVRNFPNPAKIKDVQAFIGLAGYYRRFIENFSRIAKPLTKLTKKGNKFEWTQEQQHAFDTLKEKLTTAPILKYPDFSQEFIVTTDASDYAIGAVLSQGKIGQDQPVAYASRVMARAEQNYNTTEKELLAIVWAVKHFRPYLYGTKFTIVTDHKSLVWLFNVTDPGSRLIRWRLKLEEYDYTIIHKSGQANRNADALSRYVADINKLDEEEVTSKETMRNYTEEEKQRILYEYHDAPLGGHQGVERTINRIRQIHNWRGITKDVENYIAKCESCQKNKLTRKFKAPLIVTDTADKPFEKCALDIVGPLTVTNNGNRYILTFQDSLTKFSKAIPISNQEAATIAKEFVTKIIFEHGIPGKVLTDQGTNFLSEIFKNTCKLLKIEKIQTTAYHPESNGALERSHRTLAEYLRHYINSEQTDWDEWISYAMFAYNTTPHTATGFTPFELIYGHRATLPTALTQPPKPTYTYDDYAQELKEKLRATQQIAKEHLKIEKVKAKENYDKKTKGTTFKVGEKVLLHDETVRRGRSKKLDSLWVGPYTITEKNSEVNYTIKKGEKPHAYTSTD